VQLHKRDVVEAATAILDNYGIADLTMRRLGRELNVSPGALYWHFANKQQLLGAIADRLLESSMTGPAAGVTRRGDLPTAARRTAVAHRRR
jgi:AcrR family transcriptional regulator